MSSAGTSTNRSGSGEALFEDCLDAFITHLRNRGLCDGQICHLAIGNVDRGTLDRFLDHDCVCPGSFEAPQPRAPAPGMSIPSRSS